MDIITDAYYSIGKMHLVCEDYACHGRNPVPYVTLSDGCSSSINTDVGARLLALNAQRFIHFYLRSALSIDGVAKDGAVDTDSYHWGLGRQLAALSARQIETLGLEQSAIDATLIVAYRFQDRVRVHVYGDGCIAARHRDGTVHAIQIDYIHNTPYYLSYLTADDRQQAYQEITPPLAQVIRQFKAGEVTVEQHNHDQAVVFDFNLLDYPAVAVTTDGLSSFVHSHGGESVELLEVAKELLDLKNVNDDFVKRRLRWMLVNYNKRNIYNVDDVGCGVFARVD